MKSMKRLFLQTKPMYIILLTISGIFMALGTFIAINGLNIAVSISFCLGIFFSLQVIHLILHCFPMSLAMGESRKKSIHNIFFFTIILSISISIFINLMLVFSSYTSIAKSVIPYLMGHNWNIIDGLLAKVITLMLLLSTLSGSVIWFASGFKVKGFFNGSARILIIIIFILGELSMFTNYLLWGRNLLLVNIMLLLTALLTYYLSYRTLIDYELK